MYCSEREGGPRSQDLISKYPCQHMGGGPSPSLCVAVPSGARLLQSTKGKPHLHLGMQCSQLKVNRTCSTSHSWLKAAAKLIAVLLFAKLLYCMFCDIAANTSTCDMLRTQARRDLT